MDAGKLDGGLTPQNAAIIVSVAKTKEAADLPMPQRKSAAASGFDLHANVAEAVTLKPMQRAKIPTGIMLALPNGFEAQIRSRSGLALSHGVVLVSGVGTVDADYRGEISAVLINMGDEDFTIQRGDRIAQMVIAPIADVSLAEVAHLPPTERGADGFGSTGIGK